MLIELWEKLRGYDKWDKASAKVIETRVVGDGSHAPAQSLWCKFTWSDKSGVAHESEIIADEESSLYQLIEGDVFEIRVDPLHKGEFYLPQLLESQALTLRRGVLMTLMGALLLIGFFLPDVVRILAKK